jgi:hypothetical protein
MKESQPKKLRAIIKELRASETKMKEGDHIGFGMFCLLIFLCAMLFLIEGEPLIFIVLSGCLGLGILSYYWITVWRERRAWYWEEIRREFEGKGLRGMWDTCERGDWLLWFAAHMIGKDGWPTHQQVVLTSCQCARLALRHVTSGETRPLRAIETAEAWTRGEMTLNQAQDAGRAADYMEHDNTAYCAAQAAKAAAWAIYVTEDGCCFRLAQAASEAPTRAAWATGYAEGKHAEQVTLRECADITRRMLRVPNELTNALPLYDWVKRWDTNINGKRTGRINYIPIALSRGSQNFERTGNEIDNASVNPILRVGTVVVVFAAVWALLAGLNRNPIHYYTTLRWLTCSAALVLIWRGTIQGSLKWAYVLGPVAILFNPLIPIHLHGKRLDVLTTWHVVDIIAAGVLVLAVILMEIQVLLTKKH